MNRLPPRAELTDPALPLSPEALAVIATLARTYDAQRLRLIERRPPGTGIVPAATLRSLATLEPGVAVDGAPVSASIVDAVNVATRDTGDGVTLPLPEGPGKVQLAEAGWWDALLGDVERRTGLPPRSIKVALPATAAPEVRDVFADRVA